MRSPRCVHPYLSANWCSEIYKRLLSDRLGVSTIHRLCSKASFTNVAFIFSFVSSAASRLPLQPYWNLRNIWFTIPTPVDTIPTQFCTSVAPAKIASILAGICWKYLTTACKRPFWQLPGRRLHPDDLCLIVSSFRILQLGRHSSGRCRFPIHFTYQAQPHAEPLIRVHEGIRRSKTECFAEPVAPPILNQFMYPCKSA